MNRTEAVVRMLRGEILREDTMYLRIKDGKLQMNAVSNDPDSGWMRWINGYDYLSSINLRVVEPKSKIEEAIERMLPGDTPIDRIEKSQLRRVVNLALDEAKKAFNPHDCTVVVLYHTEVNQRIDALKVKE